MLPTAPAPAIRLAFLLNGAGLALWFPRIPDVKLALEVDLLTLALCFQKQMNLRCFFV